MQETYPQTTGPEAEQMSRREMFLQAMASLEYNIAAIRTVDDVEMHAYGVMDKLPEAQENATTIAEIRRNGGDDTEAVSKQAALFSEIKHEVALISGVELDEERVKRENTKYRQRAKDLFQDMGDVSDRELLVNAGFMREDEKGNFVFQFPEDVFPPHVVEKWNDYLGLVKRHVTVLSKRELGLEDEVTAIGQLDAMRKHAHNNLSLAIKDFLLMEDWDLEKCRNFVIKMRDAAIPNISTAEENVTANALRRLIAELQDFQE
jgi:hypothetical protein